MNDLEKWRPSRRPPEDIQDAEFIEIDGVAAPEQPPRRLTLAERWDSNGPFVQLIIVCAPIFFILMALSTHGSSDTAAAVNSDAPTEAAPTATDEQRASVPPLEDALASNDPSACSHPDAVATIREHLIPQKKSWLVGGDLSDEEFVSARELATVELGEVSASNIRTNIHEISCEANLHYGDKDSERFPISYKIRPSAETGKPPVFYIQAPELATVLIMADPMDIVKAQRPKPAEADQPPKDPVAAPQADNQPNTASDDDQFAPHPQ